MKIFILTIFSLTMFALVLPAGAAVVGQEVAYENAGVTMNGYLAYDDATAEKRPGVLVVHEWWGHNDYARKRAHMLAELGYVAMAVDMYGDGKQAMHPDDAGKFAGEVMQSAATARGRFEAALERLKRHPATDAGRIAAIGYCFGGGVVLHMARAGMDLAGVVSFHGSLKTETPAEAGAVKASILVCHGAKDPLVPPEQVGEFMREMTAAGADLRFSAYPEATHSFTNPEADQFANKFSLPVGYDAEADQRSWNEMQVFFQRIFER
jgi:dienelactone hydrolase